MPLLAARRAAPTIPPSTFPIAPPRLPANTPLTFHGDGPPLLIEHLKLAERAERVSGYLEHRFVPSVRLLATRRLRELATTLPESELKTLLVLVTYLSRNGQMQATVPEIASALSVSEPKARLRLERLAMLSWDGEPLVRETHRESGMNTFVPSAAVVGSIRQGNDLDTDRDRSDIASVPDSSPLSRREAVIAASRATYSRPRAEVEADILTRMGRDPRETEDSPEGDIFRRLLAVGVPREEATKLLGEEDLTEISNQLEWLPLRAARDPARYLVAAVRGKYDAPARVQLDRAIETLDALDAGKGESSGDQVSPVAGRDA